MKKQTELEQYLDAKGWVEVHRKVEGLYASGKCRGPGWANDGYYQIIYEVTLHKKIGRTTYMKTVTESGPAIRYYGHDYAAFCDAYRRYAELAADPGEMADGKERRPMDPRFATEVIMPSLSKKLFHKNQAAFHKKCAAKAKSKK